MASQEAKERQSNLIKAANRARLRLARLYPEVYTKLYHEELDSLGISLRRSNFDSKSIRIDQLETKVKELQAMLDLPK